MDDIRISYSVLYVSDLLNKRVGSDEFRDISPDTVHQLVQSRAKALADSHGYSVRATIVATADLVVASENPSR